MVQSTHFSLDDLKNGIQVWENNTEKLTSQVDFRAFYKELFTVLLQEGFIDGSEKHSGCLTNENIEKFGILVDAADDSKFDGYKGSRHNGFFEKRQRMVKYSSGDMYDFETTWHFRVKTPVMEWWYDFKMDIACRNYQNVEVVKGNSSKTFQRGLWEFRNKAFLIPPKSEFERIKSNFSKFEPLISAKRMENIMLNHLWFNRIMYDKVWCEETANAKVYGVINKHFRNF